ncbi:MAG: DNA translocase FtsK, partial [Mariprofundaceae bacterium]|nr:DNA translocase FtsK [Mariprofundaceae bacterium]
IVAVQPGPVVVQFELEPLAGTKVSKVVSLQDDLARSMSAISVRVAGNIPGKNVIGIELPNESREMVVLHDVISSTAFSDKKKILPLALGVDIAGQSVVVDLAKMPHLLVAGTTGSGKSVSVNTMICSMLMAHTPKTLRLIMVDPKMLELSMYDDIPHLLVPVVTSPHKANKALAWAVFEMERRYKLMSEARVRNLDSYNKQVSKQEDGETLPLIVIIIDELADLMMVAGKEVELSICRLAQKARAAGLHLILATQRPSVDVITGLIKANLPSRLAFKVSSKIDSRTILDQMGAEQLLGMGDSLLMSGSTDLKRVHGAFVDDDEVLALVEYLKTQGAPDYKDEVFSMSLDDGEDAVGDGLGGSEKDEKYDEAAALVIEKDKCSVSMVQRYLRIGYNRASRIVEQMEEDGLVTPPGSGGIRKVLGGREGGVFE